MSKTGCFCPDLDLDIQNVPALKEELLVILSDIHTNIMMSNPKKIPNE
jgi:hypothetical protein